MKTRILVLSSLLLVLGMSSCSNGKEETTDEKSEKDICLYSYNEGSTNFEWVAYKTTAKKGVAGTFTDIVMDFEPSESPIEVIKSMAFTMKTASTETNDEGRNAKIVEHFFERLNTKEIYGKVTGVNEKEGTATVMISMHGISYDIEGEYTLTEDHVFSFNSSIDVTWWNGMAGIDKLNEVCGPLHAGEDGISKLWSEVGVSFSTTLQSDCD